MVIIRIITQCLYKVRGLIVHHHLCRKILGFVSGTASSHALSFHLLLNCGGIVSRSIYNELRVQEVLIVFCGGDVY